MVSSVAACSFKTAVLLILPTLVEIPVLLPVVVDDPVVSVLEEETYAPPTKPQVKVSVVSADAVMLEDCEAKFSFSVVSVRETSV